jgi:hypothetical protein
MKQIWIRMKASFSVGWEQVPDICKTRMFATIIRYAIVAAGVAVDASVDNAVVQLAAAVVAIITAFVGVQNGRKHDQKDAAISTASATLEDADGDGIPDAVENALAALKTIKAAPRVQTAGANISPATSTTTTNEENIRNS